MKRLAVSFLTIFTVAACGKDKDKGSSSYSFSATASTKISSSKLALSDSESSPVMMLTPSGAKQLCDTGQTITCAGPSELTGKYFSVGLLIQGNGKGMQSYLLEDNWSGMTGASKTYDFDGKNPITSSGALKCCGGSGDLTGENVYFSNAAYLFGYLDATFKIPYSAQQKSRVSAEMTAAHTVRFVFADDIVTGYKRGDLLYKDADATFKWIDATGTLSASRPSSPITMDSSVVTYTSPFEGLTSPIPVIYTDIGSDAEKVTTSEEQLKAEGKTYSFDFDTSSLIVFMLSSNELEIIASKKELLSRIHLSGLPSTKFTFGTAGASTLTVN